MTLNNNCDAYGFVYAIFHEVSLSFSRQYSRVRIHTQTRPIYGVHSEQPKMKTRGVHKEIKHPYIGEVNLKGVQENMTPITQLYTSCYMQCG